MTSFTAANYLNNAARTEAEMKVAFEDNLAATKQLLGGAAVTTLTIASDIITPTAAVHLVETQGAAATDDLSTITPTNLPDGSFLMLGLANSTHNVVLKHNVGGTGKLSLSAGVDFTLDLATSFILFQRIGTVWEERNRYFGTDAAAFRSFYGTAGLGQNRFTGRQEWNWATTIAAAATLPITTEGNTFYVTGSTTIVAIATAPMGTWIRLVFINSPILVHQDPALILAGGQNLQAEPGLVLDFISMGSGTWRMVTGGGGLESRVLARSTANAVLSNTTTETALYAFTIPAGTFGADRRVRLTTVGTIADNGSAPGWVEVKLYYAGQLCAQTLFQTAVGTDRIGAAGMGYTITAMLSSRSATQVGSIAIAGPIGLSGVGTQLLGNASFNAFGGVAVNTTIAQTLQLNARWNLAESQKILSLFHATCVRE
jgi:hypothetical protein